MFCPDRVPMRTRVPRVHRRRQCSCSDPWSERRTSVEAPAHGVRSRFASGTRAASGHSAVTGSPVLRMTTAPCRYGVVATETPGRGAPDRYGLPVTQVLGGARWSIRSDCWRSVIRLEGDLDGAALELLDRWVEPLAGMGRSLQVDVEGLRSCGFAELSLLLRWRTLASVAGGSMRLTSTPGWLSGLLGLVGFADTSASTADTSRRGTADRFWPVAGVAGPTCWQDPER